MKTRQPVAEPDADFWPPGLTDSRVPWRQPIQVTLQPESTWLLTAPRRLTFPAPTQESRWLTDIREKVRGYVDLAPNWDSYGGGPAQEIIVDVALKVAEVMATSGFSRPDVCPESSGGILFEWQQRDRALTVDLDGSEGFSFSFSYESPGEPEQEGGIEDFISLLRSGLQPL